MTTRSAAAQPVPIVSIVMAAKNYARFLPVALDSVWAQTMPHWELLIVDDGSTDETASLVASYTHDARIRYLRSDRLGQSRAKNLGERFSQAEFVAYLDADDAWEPTKLARQIEVMQAQPACGVVFTARQLIDEQGHRFSPNAQQRHAPFPAGYVYPEIFSKNFVCFSSVLVRKQVFEHLGGFDSQLDLAIDYDFWLRVARYYEFQGIDEPLTLYRTGHGNLSGKLIDRVRTAEAIMNRALRRLAEQDQKPDKQLLSSSRIGEGYASTYRAAAYTLRTKERAAALRWAWRALCSGGNLRENLRTLLGTMLTTQRVSSTGENASVNR